MFLKNIKDVNTEQNKIFTEDYFKLENYQQFIRLTRGELVYINHPTKGLCIPDFDNIYIKVASQVQTEK